MDNYIDNFNIDSIQALSKLNLKTAEKAKLSCEMDSILAFASQISFADASSSDIRKPCSVSKLREDIPLGSMVTELILSNCAQHDGQYVIVPRTVE